MTFWSAVRARAAIIGTIAGAVIAVVTMWSLLELPTGWLPASRSYVDAEHAKDVVARTEIVGTVIELTLDQRDRLKRARDAIQVRMTAATDPQAREDLQRLLEQANQDIADVASRINALERMRGK